VSAALLAGCGQEAGPKGPAKAKVSGTVNLDKRPMAGGEVRFNLAGQPVQVIEVKEGAFSGEAFVGQNQIDVVLEKDGPPHPMDPTQKIKVNTVDPKFSGAESPFKEDIPAAGKSDIKLEVTSAPK
jgi:hypothetical protein